MNSRHVNESEKLLFCNEKWLVLLREALSALNIALKKVNLLKNYIRKILSDESKAKGKKERSKRENTNSGDEYFSPIAVSQLNRSECSRQYHTRCENSSEYLSEDFSRHKGALQNNYGCKENSKAPLITNLKEEIVDSCKRKRKRRKGERLNDVPIPLNIDNRQEENKFDTYCMEECQSTRSIENSFCDLSEAENKSTSISEEDLLKVRFRIDNNRIQDTEVKAALEKEGFLNCVVKVKNKETYSRGHILFLGGEVEKASRKKFNILIQNQPLKIRQSVKTSSSFSPNSVLDINSSTEMITEHVMDQDCTLNDKPQKTSPMRTQEFNINEAYSTDTNCTPKLQRAINIQKSSTNKTQENNIDISKGIALLSTRSIQLIKSMAESFMFDANLTGESSLKTDKSSDEIVRSCGLNDVLIGKFSSLNDLSVLGTDTLMKYSGRTNEDCSMEIASNTNPDLKVVMGTDTSYEIPKNIPRLKTKESMVFEGKYIKQDDTLNGNNCGEIGGSISVNLSHDRPSTGVGINKNHCPVGTSGITAPEHGATIDMTEKDNSSSITQMSMPISNESDDCKSKYGKQDDIDKGSNCAEIGGSILVNLSHDRPSTGVGINKDFCPMETSGRTAPERGATIHLTENDNSSNVTNKMSMPRSNESDNCKGKYGKQDDIDKGSNCRSEIDESMLINISCGYPSTRDSYPQKGKYNEMGRNSPTMNHSSESDTNDRILLSKNVETTPYKNSSQNNPRIPDLKCSISEVHEARIFNSLTEVNSVVSDTYSNFDHNRRFEHKTGNNFNFFNRAPNENFRSVPPHCNIAANRQYFHPNQHPSQRPSIYNQRYKTNKSYCSKPLNNKYLEGNRDVGNRHFFSPFSRPSSSSQNHGNENEFKNRANNLNSSQKLKKNQQFYQRNSF